MYSKNNTLVEFPFEELDLGEYAAVSEGKEKRCYNLYGIIVSSSVIVEPLWIDVSGTLYGLCEE